MSMSPGLYNLIFAAARGPGPRLHQRKPLGVAAAPHLLPGALPRLRHARAHRQLHIPASGREHQTSIPEEPNPALCLTVRQGRQQPAGTQACSEYKRNRKGFQIGCS